MKLRWLVFGDNTPPMLQYFDNDADEWLVVPSIRWEKSEYAKRQKEEQENEDYEERD